MNSQEANAASQAAWDANAAYWDEYMGAEATISSTCSSGRWCSGCWTCSRVNGCWTRRAATACMRASWRRWVRTWSASTFAHAHRRARAYPPGDDGAIAYHVLDATGRSRVARPGRRHV
ncbi:MAG: hypothetical protein R2851_00395 [Caldilineaceae bacterium]